MAYCCLLAITGSTLRCSDRYFKRKFMIFYKSLSASSVTAPKDAAYPCIVIMNDVWDDYDFRTLHHLYYFPAKGKLWKKIGGVKFLQKGVSSTELPFPFEILPIEFASLGQNVKYYETVLDLFPDDFRDVLLALNDVVISPSSLEAVETKPGFRNSLARYNEAKIALRHGLAALHGEAANEDYQFDYRGEIPGSSTKVKVRFKLDPNDLVPGRIVAIIGRNGVGKTQFLARLALDLATPLRMSKESAEVVEQSFSPRRPLFSRVIALSFSAFDKFVRPQKKSISYIYCGVRDDGGKLSRTALEKRHVGFLDRIKDQNKEGVWEKHVAAVLGVSRKNFSIEKYIGLLKADSSPSMSSGQSILIYFISATLAYLKEGSLVLFDEPEIHLHPAAVAMLMQILQSLLKEYDSYAILATHSPVVIQEVPGRRVVNFERDGDVTIASPLGQESFGENISELTRIVFETVETPSFYKKVLKELAEERTFDEVSELFEDELSMHAAAYLASIKKEQ